MKRSGSAVLIAVSTILLSSPARAQDQEMVTAKALCEHGAWDAAEEYADSLIAAGKADAFVLKAWAQAGRAAKEKNPKGLEQAKKTLSDAKAKGAKIPPGFDPEKLPPNKFGAPDFELRFAWTLKNRGKIGAAEQVLDTAIAGAGFAARDLASAKTIRGDLYGERSRIPELGNSDAPKRKEYFDKAKALFLEVAGTQGLAPELLIEAKGHLYDLYSARGTGLLDAAKRADELAAQEALKKEAVEAFKAGVEFLEKECKELEAAVEKAMAAPAEPGKDGEPAHKKPEEFLLIYANYYWPKCLVGQARATTDKAEHDSLVKKALAIYDEYNLRFGQEDQGYEAAIDMSDAYKEIGDEESALISLESALSIEKNRSPEYDPLHPPDPKKGLKLDSGSLDVFARASLNKGKGLKNKRDWKKSLAALDKPFADAKASGPEIEKEFLATPLAKSLLIERAEALGRDGKMKEAQADLNKIIKEDENGPTGQSARAMLAKLAGGGGGGATDDALAGVDSGRALALMNEALTKGELNTAASYSRLAIRKAKDEGKSDVIPQALVGLGQAYYELGRFYEAAIAYDEVCRRYKDSKVAGEASRGVVNCYNFLRLRAPNGHDKAKFDDALKFLTDNFQNESKGFGEYLLALQYQEDKKFEEAAKYYDKVPPEAGDIYDKSLYTSSLCRYLLAQDLLKEKKDAKDSLNATVSGLKKALEVFAKNDGVADDRKKKRFDLDAEVRFLLADVLLKEAVNKPAEVLPLFERAAKDYEGNADRLSRAGFWCILANLKLGRLEAAESECNILLEKYKGEKRTVLACKEVGVALHRDVEAKKKTLSPEDRKKLKARIAKYYARWILDGSEKADTMPPLRDMQKTANHLFEIALDISGQPEDGGFIQEIDENTFDAGDAKQIFADARDIYAKLAEPETLKNFQKDNWVILAYMAEAASFIKDWPTALKAFERFLEETKLIDSRTTQIDVNIVGKNKVLLAYYFDLGKAYQMMGSSDKANYQKAMDVFSNVVNAASEQSRTWWKAKYELYNTLQKRGDEKDFKELGTAIKALERKYPDFKDAAKGGMQEKFQKLRSDLEAKGIK